MREVKSKRTSYIKALVLFAVLIMVYILYYQINRSGVFSDFTALFDADFESYRNLAQFDDDQKKEITEELAGFWQFSKGDPSVDPVSKIERLELIDNGIVWHMIHWTINLPSGKQVELAHGRHAYFEPFSYNPDESAKYSEAWVIRQLFILDNDTCYGESQVLELWEFDIFSDTLIFNNRIYTHYDGELKDFFPEDQLLDVINRIDLNTCRRGASLSQLAKRAVLENMSSFGWKSQKEAIANLIDLFYKPAVIDEMVRDNNFSSVPDSISYTLTIAFDGSVENVRNNRTSTAARRFNDALIKEINSWVFTESQDEGTVQYLLELRLR